MQRELHIRRPGPDFSPMNPSNHPDPKVIGFSWPNARACLDLCEQVYDDETVPVICSPRTDAECLYQEFDDCVVLAFRGSKSAKDYLQDSKYEMYPRLMAGELVDVHDGFFEDFDSIITRIISWLSGRSMKPVFVTGHSLGGAEAILAALELEARCFRVIGVYTFGQPRVGAANFRDVYNSAQKVPGPTLKDRTWRVVNQNDIVPRVPPALNGYRHCGNLIFLPVGGGWVLNPSIWSCGWSNLRGLFNAFTKRKEVLLSEHHSASYEARIANLS